MSCYRYIILLFLPFLIIYVCFFPLTLSAEIKKTKTGVSDRQVKLTWEEVSDAEKYRIDLKDAKGRSIHVDDTEENSVVLDLAPGNYKLRIGVINKFQKLGVWSDWTDVKIEEPRKAPVIAEEKKESKPAKKDLFGAGLKIGAGVSYFQIMPDWNKYFKNSINSVTINAAYSFRFLQLPSSLSFLKFAGFDIDWAYVRFKSSEEFNQIEGELTDKFYSINLFISTNFDFPLNAAIRGGWGIASTRLDFLRYNTLGNYSDKGHILSNDNFFKAGVSVEYRFYSCLFIECAADYYLIKYLESDFECLSYTVRLGLRL